MASLRDRYMEAGGTVGYVIGIDLGTTYTAAAVWSGDRAEVVQLGNRSAAVPSVVFVHDDTTLVGDAAVRRGIGEPDRLAREFKRRLGDPVPLLLGGVPLSAETLVARLLRSTLEIVIRREGRPPDLVALSHPANWGPFKLELFDQVIRLADLSAPLTITEPEAAAVHYASLERVVPGDRVAVYDLGGGTFDAAVLARTDAGFAILGTPQGIERLGGIDIDQAVVGHVVRALGPALDALDRTDPAVVAGLAHLQQECVEAKEALSSDTETSIHVSLPGLHHSVRLTRSELEGFIELPLAETISCLRRALRAAAVEPGDLAAVLLVGGSSRIPLVAELVGAELGRPVAVDADPKHVVALGAARAGATHLSQATPTRAPTRPAPPAPAVASPASSPPNPPPPPITPPAPPMSIPTPAPPSAAAPGSLAPPVPGASPYPAPSALSARSAPLVAAPSSAAPGRRRRLALAGAAVVAAVAAGVVGVVALGGDGEPSARGFVTACPPPGDPAMCISSVSFEGDGVVAEFSTQNLDPAFEAFGDELAAVFFLASVSRDDAATLEGRTSAWLPWGVNSPFGGTNAAGQRGFTQAEIPAEATALCVLIGDTDGTVALNTGNCAELPGHG